MNFSNNINKKLIGGRGYRKINKVNQVPNFSKLYDNFVKEGYDNSTASIKAHAIIQQHARSQPDYEEDDEEDLHTSRVITRSLEKMKLETAKLSNKYKNDKNLLRLLNYLDRVINMY